MRIIELARARGTVTIADVAAMCGCSYRHAYAEPTSSAQPRALLPAAWLATSSPTLVARTTARG
jgi:hypothetical protein